MSTHLKLLVVEANRTISKSIIGFLKDYKPNQLDLITSESLYDALNVISEQEIDLIILDLMLPDSSGIDTFRSIQNLALQTPIIILTELKDKTIANTAVEEGAQYFISKGNLNRDILAVVISYAIEKKKNEIIVNDYIAISENINEAIISLSMDGLIRNINHTAQELFSFSNKEIIGSPIFKLVPTENKETLNQILSLIKSGGYVWKHEVIFKDKSNKLIECFVNVSPIKDNKERITGAIIMAQDITGHKQAEKLSAVQLRVATVLAELNNLQNVAHSILKAMCEILDFQVGEIWALDSTDNVLIQVSNWSSYNITLDFHEISYNLRFHIGEGIPGYVWQTKRCYWDTNLLQSPMIYRKSIMKKNNLNCTLGIPIIFGEEILGVLLFFGSRMVQPDLSMMFMFEVIGKQIGTFIKRKRLEEDLLNLAEHDILTGFANRFSMEVTLKKVIDEAREQKTQVAIVYLDLDRFKHINDILGHQKGDMVLKEFATRLSTIIQETDIIARFGADEFAIILSDIKSKARVSGIAQKILDMAVLPFLIDKIEFYLTASIGISIYPNDGEDASSLFIAADLALNKVKQAGGNAYEYSSKIIGEIEQKKILKENLLHNALENNEFFLLYQPITNVQNNQIESMEALIRWKTKEGDILTPDQFVPLLEKSNLIISVGEWVLRTACKQMKEWERLGLHDISVNVSIHQLNNNFMHIINTIIKELKIKPGTLVLEFTESILMKESKLMIYIFNELKKLGISTSIDDFGTGYSSFSYLQKFEFAVMKIDKSFIDNIHRSNKSDSIINGIVTISKILGLHTIAEGVETEEQLDFLKKVGCDQYQGYYFSKPLPPDAVTTMLKKQKLIK